MNIKLATGIAAAVFLAATSAPVFAATTVNTSHNGAGSLQVVTVTNKQKTKVTQSNATAVLNLTGVFQNTGGGSTSGNTGGKVTQKSGNTTSNVTNDTTTGGNSATVSNCGCQLGNTDVTTNHNGAGSVQIVSVTNKKKTKVSQTNETLVVNGTLVVQNTGGLTADNNTGGDVDQTSGDASSTVTNTTTTGDNTVTIN